MVRSTVAAGLVLAACASSSGRDARAPAGSATNATSDGGATPKESRDDGTPDAALTGIADSAASDNGTLTELLFFSVNVNDTRFTGTLNSCIIDGGSELIQTVFQATGSGKTDDGEPFNMLIGQYVQDTDGDGVQDTQMQLSVEVGRASTEEPAPTGKIFVSGQSNDAANGAVGRMEATLASNGVIDGFGTVHDFSGVLAAPDEALDAIFHVECGSQE